MMSSPPMSAGDDIRYGCHACGAEQHAEGWCQTCGPARFHFRQGDGSGGAEARCTECGHSAEPGARVAPLPSSCRACASSDLGWRDASGRWVPEPMPVGPGEGPWICGDFDADCTWRTPADYRALGSDSGDLLANSFPLAGITRAQLENPTSIDAPPLERRQEDQRAPLRLDTLHDVYVYREQGDEVRVYRVSLTDVRLHDWLQTLQPDVAEGVVHGRLQGKAYARLMLKPALRPRKQPANEARRWLSSVLPSEEENTKAITTEGRHCNTCNLFLMAAVFLLLYLACDWLSGLVGLAAMALQCRWRTARMRDGRNRMPRWLEIAVGLLLVVLATLLYLGLRVPACEGQAVLWWLAGIALLLVLTALLRRCWPWLLVTLVWVLALMAYFCGTRPDCSSVDRTTAVEAISAPAGSSPRADGLGAAPASPPAGSDNGAGADESSGLRWPSLPELNPLPAMANAVDKLRDGVEQILTHDADAQRVEDQSTGNGRVSVDQALRQPDRYFSCNPRRADQAGGADTADSAPRSYSIYLGEAALFDKDSAALGPGAEPHLRKLARLLERRPDARLILTGHADSSGQRDHNLLLSQRRADAVADWLMNNAGLPADRIEIRAAGDRQPLVDRPGLYRLNRRVEVALDCSRRTTP